MKIRHPIRAALCVVGGIQVVAGFAISGSCKCAPDVRSMGLLVAFGMGAFVVGFLAAGAWSRTRPRRAVLVAVALEILLLQFLSIPGIQPGVHAWLTQIPVLLALTVALVFAFLD